MAVQYVTATSVGPIDAQNWPIRVSQRPVSSLSFSHLPAVELRMLIAIVDFTVAPENRPSALTAILAAAPAIRAMTNNLGFQAYVDPENSGAIRILQEWQDGASFEVYTASAEFKRLGQLLRPLMIDPPVSRRMKADLLVTVG
jgi:quinol monooxygenase YgiN